MEAVRDEMAEEYKEPSEDQGLNWYMRPPGMGEFLVCLSGTYKS